MERNCLVKEEGIGDVVGSVALEVDDQPELVVDLLFSSQLLEPLAEPPSELWEPDGRDQHPGAPHGTLRNSSYWIIRWVLCELLVRVVKLLTQRVLHVVELADGGMDVGTDVAALEVVCGHGLKFGVSLLLCKHGSRCLIKQITPDDPVSSDVDSSLLLVCNSVGFVV